MEAIGAAATVVQLLSFTGEVLALGYGYLSKVKKAPSEIRALLKETAMLNELLDQISELRDDQVIPGNDKPKNVLTALTRLGVLDDCDKTIKTVEGMLKSCAGIEGQGVRNAGKRLLWPFKEKDTNNLFSQLGRIRETLSAAIMVDSAKTLQIIEECSSRIDKNLIQAIGDIVSIQNEQSDIKTSLLGTSSNVAFLKAVTESKIEEEEKLAIRRWVCPEEVDSDSRLYEANSQRHQETGHWFVKVVTEWIVNHQACIWFHGIAGSGKTVLAATAVEYLRSQEIFHGTLVLHFFCDRRDPRKQSIQDLHHAIITQILDQNTDSITEVKHWRDERMMAMSGSVAKPLTLTEHVHLMQKLCLAWSRVVLIVDALDECCDIETMSEGLAQLTRGANIKLLITSRFDVEMQRALEPLATSQVPLSGHMQGDIRVFLQSEIKSRIARGSLKFRTQGLNEQIVTELQVKADGMILLAKLHLDYICAPKSDRAIKEALARLPSKIYSAYDEILDQICSKSPESVEELKRTLQWLTYSIVPISLRQLAEVVSIQKGDTSLDESGIVTDYMDLVALCGSLVTVLTNERNAGRSIIKLSHTSVEEYFKSGKMRQDLVEVFGLRSDTANLAIARICTQYISFEDFSRPLEIEERFSHHTEYPTGRRPPGWLLANKRCLEKRSSQYTVADYASRYWFDHLRQLDPAKAIDREVENHLEWFFDSARHRGKYRSWQQMYHRDIRYYCRNRPALHYAIEFKVDALVSRLLPDKADIDTLLGGKSALHIAARCGALTTMKKLIALGADINLASGPQEKGMTVLHFAAEGGHEEALTLLLAHGASVKSRSTSKSTPFYRAARSGSLEALKILYDAGSEINAETWDRWTPLFESTTYGRRRIASQLLQWGADPSITTFQGESTLSIIQRKMNKKEDLGNHNLSGQAMVAPLQSEADILATIEAIKTLGSAKEIKEEFDKLLSGVQTQFLLVRSMDKDTRPGTEREKDQRFPNDPEFLITTEEYRERYDEEDAEPQKLSSRLED